MPTRFGRQDFPSDVFYNFGWCGKNFSFQKWFHDNILQKLTLYSLTLFIILLALLWKILFFISAGLWKETELLYS